MKYYLFSFFITIILLTLLIYSCYLLPMNEDEYNILVYNYPIIAISPSPLLALSTTIPFFDWTNVQNITHYHFQIGTTRDFSGTLIIDDETLTKSEYQIAEPLNINQIYYWRVRAKNTNDDWLMWSDVWKFYIAEATKITASDGDSDDYFGYSVSISYSGDSFVVGAYNDEDNGYESGSVYIYKWNGISWDETKITASDGDSDDYFGYSVSISYSGDSFVVGAYRDEDNGYESGSVYIYKWNGISWDETKITASDGDSFDYFGCSVSISSNGDSIAVGAEKDNKNGSGGNGSVYLYKWNGTSWDETKIIPSDGDSSYSFGHSVSFASTGDSFVVSDCRDKDNGYESGSVYIYKWNGISWNETKITASDGDSDDQYGLCVSISSDGDSFVVGAHNDEDNGYESGSVYIYKWNGISWNETKITASDGDSYDQYGLCVSISSDGDSFVVGAYRDEDNGYESGSVYVYK